MKKRFVIGVIIGCVLSIGTYINKDIEFYEYWYSKGYKRAVTEFLSEESKKIIAYID